MKSKLLYAMGYCASNPDSQIISRINPKGYDQRRFGKVIFEEKVCREHIGKDAALRTLDELNTLGIGHAKFNPWSGEIVFDEKQTEKGPTSDNDTWSAGRDRARRDIYSTNNPQCFVVNDYVVEEASATVGQEISLVDIGDN